MSAVMMSGSVQTSARAGAQVLTGGAGSYGGQREARREPARAPQGTQGSGAPRTGAAWLSVEEVAHLLLAGEFVEARVPVPARFSPEALASAVSSIERWREEGRVFAIHDLYPRYQFDNRGRPHPAVERALMALGSADALRLGNWFSAPNRHLDGKRPQELLAIAPVDVLRALELAVIMG